MIRIKPIPEKEFACPNCHSHHVAIRGVHIPGMTSTAECHCEQCGFDFHAVLPEGHTSDYTVFISSQTKKIFDGRENPEWLSDVLLSSVTNVKDDDIVIRKTVNWKTDKVILLNALDYIYGHSLLKLLNATHHLNYNREFGLIVIAPAALEWMIPKGCAEVWIVDSRLGDLRFGHSRLDRFVQNELNRFEEVYLSKAYSHPDLSHVNLRRFTGVSPFDLRYFGLKKPTITFILREDRWWWTSAIDYWLYRVCRKLKIMNWGSRRLALRQNELVKETIRHVKAMLPQTEFFVAGLGKTGNFDGLAKDVRSINITPSIEKNWCTIYANSHVVMGVHGSNMLLPTAFAASCVEILPEDRYGNIVQDIAVKYADRRQLFLYRFADQFSSPRIVGNKIISIIRDYERYYRNMVVNVYEKKSRERDKSFIIQ